MSDIKGPQVGAEIRADEALGLQVQGDRLLATIDGKTVFDIRDTDRPLSSGAVAYVVEEGRIQSDAMSVEPISPLLAQP